MIIITKQVFVFETNIQPVKFPIKQQLFTK